MGEEEEVVETGAEMEEHKVAVEEVQPQVYPAPLHSHEEVVRDKLAFMESLRRFHSSMSTKFILVYYLQSIDGPLVKAGDRGEEMEGGHRGVQVSAHHHQCFLCAEKILPELAPPLRAVECVVHCKHDADGVSRVVRAASSQTRTPPGKLERGVVVSDSTMQTSKTRKRPLPEPQNRGEVAVNSLLSFSLKIDHYECIKCLVPTGPHNFTVTGSIDGKFEYGYMVTVKIGSDTLRGVLYHVHQPSASSSTLAKAPPETANAPSSSAVTRTRLRRRRGCRHRDPAHPKPNRSAYNFFFAEKHSKLKALYPHREREFSKMIGESWNKLSVEERMV
ncbi:hypothetical protein GW17_00040787 [Ensete ventricosum]|nr:hypothetical protein GW17_00040787 [Ensete ventricosum]